MKRLSFLQEQGGFQFSYLGYATAALLLLSIFTVLIHFALQGNIIGADFFTFWTAGHALFQEHINPYSEYVTNLSQLGIYGRLALPHEDQVAFAYPMYSLLIIFPTTFVPFDWAVSFWIALNLLVVCSIFFLIFPASAKLFSTTSLLLFPLTFGLILGNFAVLVGIAVLLYLGMVLVHSSRSLLVLVASAVLIAWATSKPQFVWFYLIFILLTAIRLNLWLFIKTFLVSLFVFFILSLTWMPGWIPQWLQRVGEYASYNPSQPPIIQLLAAMIPNPIASVLGGIIIALSVGVSLFLMYQWWKSQQNTLIVIAWVGLTTFLAHPHGTGQEQFTFLIPLILWMSIAHREQAKPAYLFWFGTMVISWLPVLSGNGSTFADRSPVLFNAIWVLWLTYTSLRKECVTSPIQSPKAGLSA